MIKKAFKMEDNQTCDAILWLTSVSTFMSYIPTESVLQRIEQVHHLRATGSEKDKENIY